MVVDEGTVDQLPPDSSSGGKKERQGAVDRVMKRLEVHVKRNLAQWIRIQEVQNLLERHCGDRYRRDIAGFEHRAHIGPLTAVIRGLVAERVPIREFTRIYDTYRRLWEGKKGVQTMIREIRCLPEVRPGLWGNDEHHSRFVLAARAEAELLQAMRLVQGIPILALEPRRRAELVAAVVAAAADVSLASLTVGDRVLRPLVRRLIEDDLPEVPVLAREELECLVAAVEAVEIGIPEAQSSGEVTT